MADQIPGFEQVTSVIEQVIPGDIIEFEKGKGSNYGLYMGDEFITIAVPTSEGSKEAKVNVLKVQDVAGDSLARVRNFSEDALSIFKKNPLPLDKILEHAKVFQDKLVPFEGDFRNSEYYATLWRYGKGFSERGASVLEKVPGMGLVTNNPVTHRFKKYMDYSCSCDACKQ